MYGNTSLPVTQRECVSRCQLLLQLKRSTMASVNNMSRQRSFGKFCMISVQCILASTNKNIIGQMFPEVLK